MNNETAIENIIEIIKTGKEVTLEVVTVDDREVEKFEEVLQFVRGRDRCVNFTHQGLQNNSTQLVAQIRPTKPNEGVPKLLLEALRRSKLTFKVTTQ